jgi:hypothetical protein
MITSKGVYQFLFGLTVLAVVGYIGTKIKDSIDTTDKDEYELIKKYLLNDSPLYGYNKPKLWIHTKYEINARNWRDFYSRNTTDLNQPYIHVTIRSIINHCADDFHICLIDDDTFSKLIPAWDFEMRSLADPLKSQLRELGFAQLLYYYGGFIVPDSFLCSKNLMPLYLEGVSKKNSFVIEKVSKQVDFKDKRGRIFVPDMYFMGANKNDDTVKELAEFLKNRAKSVHVTNEAEFRGQISHWLMGAIHIDKMTLIRGEYVGIKTNKGSEITVEDLMEEAFLDLHSSAYGVYIPEDEMLSRTKYQWFPVSSVEELMDTRIILAKYMKASMVDFASIYQPPGLTGEKSRNVISI